jgi:hypothetical protein
MTVFEAECPIYEMRFNGKTEKEVRQKVEKHSFKLIVSTRMRS